VTPWGGAEAAAIIDEYCVRLRSHPQAHENFAMAQTKRLILREERTFVEVVEGTFEISAKRLHSPIYSSSHIQ